MIYLGGAWPEEYRDQIFMNNIHGHRLNVDVLTPKGSRLRRPATAPTSCWPTTPGRSFINLQLRPRRQRLHDRLVRQASRATTANPKIRDRTNGRIYKICYEGRQAGDRVDLQKLDDEELVAAAAATTNDWYVRHARRILQERAASRRSSARLST